MAIKETRYNEYITVNGNQTITLAWTHPDFDANNSVIPAISIGQSDSVLWDDDWGGVWGPDTKVKIESYWVEHEPAPVDLSGEPLGFRKYENKILVRVTNMSPNVARIVFRFIYF